MPGKKATKETLHTTEQIRSYLNVTSEQQHNENGTETKQTN